MPDLLFFLLLGHFCGDFALQSDAMAKRKGTSKRMLTLHVSIYTLTIAAAMLAAFVFAGLMVIVQWITLPVLAFIFVTHWVQDYIKGNGSGHSKQSLFADQALHVLVLFAVRLIVYNA